jgi:hypothetical protein
MNIGDLFTTWANGPFGSVVAVAGGILFVA